MDWDKQVPACFGNSDLSFANHPADEGRAFEWLVDLRQRNVGWAKVEAQLRAFLKERGAGGDHIAIQIDKASARMKPWLLD